MKRKMVILGVVAAFAAGVVVFVQWQPPRLTASTLEKANEVQRKLDQEKEENVTPNKTTIAQAETKAAEPAKKEAAKPETAKAAEPAKPEAAAPSDNVFRVKFECSNGTFVVECHRDWAPLGAARFEQLVKEGFYNGDRFFRVLPNFVVQFGLSGDPEVSKKWRDNTIKDDPVKQSNTVGTVTFAKSDLPNSRTTQIFINLKDNKDLDAMHFSAFGKVVEGMDVVKAINAQYGQTPDQGLIQSQGNAYLEKSFPKLDYVKSATVVK